MYRRNFRKMVRVCRATKTTKLILLDSLLQEVVDPRHLVFQRLSTANYASSFHYSCDREGMKWAKTP
jgi:hypothetical protein